MKAIDYLQQIANLPCTSEVLVAQGIAWAEASCRIDGTMSLALRGGSYEAGENLLKMAVAAKCDTMATAGRWLNDNREDVLQALLAG